AAEVLGELRLQAVVVLVEDVQHIIDGGVAGIRPELVQRPFARSAGESGAARDLRVADAGVQERARSHLIDVHDALQVGAMLPEIAHIQNRWPRDLLLQVEREILHIRRLVLDHSCVQVRRRAGGAWSGQRIAIVHRIAKLRGGIVRLAKERRIGEDLQLVIVYGRLVIEHAVAAAQRRPAIAKQVIREANAWSEVMPLRLAHLLVEGRAVALNRRSARGLSEWEIPGREWQGVRGRSGDLVRAGDHDAVQRIGYSAGLETV